MACHNEKLKYVFASFGVLKIFYHKFCILLCILLYCALFCYEFSVFSLMGIVNHSFGSPRCSNLKTVFHLFLHLPSPSHVENLCVFGCYSRVSVFSLMGIVNHSF